MPALPGFPVQCLFDRCRTNLSQSPDRQRQDQSAELRAWKPAASVQVQKSPVNAHMPASFEAIILNRGGHCEQPRETRPRGTPLALSSIDLTQGSVEYQLSSQVLLKHRTQSWQVAVCVFVLAYLALGVATNSLRAYHWFMLLTIPGALMSGERGRRFFLDWAPLFAFWLVYDRLRLIQPLLYARVAVDGAFLIERAAFGWLAGGEVPAHQAHAWLGSNPGILASGIEWAAQVVYFSHLFVVPLAIAGIWMLGSTRQDCRASFLRHVRAFTVLNFSAIVIYLALPVAPPWWVTLNGMAKPTADLITNANMSAAMHGALIQGMIRNASQWFAAVPSLHGAYPVLLLLLFPRRKNRLLFSVAAVYCCAMWVSTVVLNQHYVIDLVAGAVLAIAAWWLEPLVTRLTNRESSSS